jgi:beta propeller repeat protein
MIMAAPARFRNRNLILAGLFCAFLLLLPAGAIPAGTETRISFSRDPGCMNIYPSSDGGWIVWEETCPGLSQTIIAYNYTSGVQLPLPNSTLLTYAPNIRKNRVVWYEDAGGGMDDIYYTDLDSLPLTAHKVNVPSSVKNHPVVDGGNIVWQNQEPISGTYDILLYNLTSGILYNLTPDTPDTDQVFPSIYGDRVVWQNNRMSGSDIFMNDTGAGWMTTNLTPGLLPAFNSRPVMNDNSIVWYDDTNTIYLSDLTTTSVVAGDPAISVSNPSVCSTYVVWKEDTSPPALWYDVMLYNLTTSVKEPVTNAQSVDPDTETSPVLITPDSRIIWVDDRNGQPDVYMFTYGVSGTCPVAGFSVNVTEGPAPLTVEFSDTSSGSPSLWRWDFGDGSYDMHRNTTHTFSSSGIYSVRLISGNSYCRSTSDVQTISVGTPHVDFSSAPTEGLVPLTVAFSGTATGSPSGWLWKFGDGATSTQQNPVHTYTSAGTYTVNLSATNSYGTTVASKAGYITVKNGARNIAFTNITGISVADIAGRQIFTYNKNLVPDYSLTSDKTTLVSRPPPEYGWQNITFVSNTGTSFDDGAGNIIGSISPVILQTRDILPSSFPPEIGSNLEMNYETEYLRYSSPAYLVTEVWEGTTSLDNLQFEDIIHRSGYTSKNVAYTMSVSYHNLPTPLRERINLSISSDWVAGITGIDWGRDHTFVIAKGYDSAGNLAGTIVKPVFAGNDSVNHLEYFKADIPPQFAYVTTFALARLSGSGNPFQLITLTIATYISPGRNSGSNPESVSGSDSDSGTGTNAPAAVQNTQVPQLKPSSLPVTGKTAKLYSNAQGVITQATTLQSADGLARVSVMEGIVAKDSTGAALSSITINSLPAESVPGIPDGSVFTYGGMAYELQPDGGTFSPPISLTFTVPQAHWGQDFIVRTFDRTSGVWQEVPTTYNPNTGVVNAEVNHFCCFALFSKAVTSVPSDLKTTSPAHMTPDVIIPPPPPTAMSIFTGMILWVVDIVTKNVLVVAGIAVLVASVYLYGRKRRRDRIMYLV